MEGVGVLLNLLSGEGEDPDGAFADSIDKRISAFSLEEDEIRMTFTDGTAIKFLDNGQSCCEQRYITTGDDLAYHVGGTLLNANTEDAPSVPDEYGNHEVQFLRITTSKGVAVFETHNEHNGYYGGFSVICRRAS